MSWLGPIKTSASRDQGGMSSSQQDSLDSPDGHPPPRPKSRLPRRQIHFGGFALPLDHHGIRASLAVSQPSLSDLPQPHRVETLHQHQSYPRPKIVHAASDASMALLGTVLTEQLVQSQVVIVKDSLKFKVDPGYLLQALDSAGLVGRVLVARVADMDMSDTTSSALNDPCNSHSGSNGGCEMEPVEEGDLVQRIVRDRSLASSIAVVVENVDPLRLNNIILLGILPGVLRTRPDLRLILLRTDARADSVRKHSTRFSPRIVKPQDQTPYRIACAAPDQQDEPLATASFADVTMLKLHYTRLQSTLTGALPLFKHFVQPNPTQWAQAEWCLRSHGMIEGGGKEQERLTIRGQIALRLELAPELALMFMAFRPLDGQLHRLAFTLLVWCAIFTVGAITSADGSSDGAGPGGGYNVPGSEQLSLVNVWIAWAEGQGEKAVTDGATLGLDESRCRSVMTKLVRLCTHYHELFGAGVMWANNHKCDTADLDLLWPILLETHIVNRAMLENPMETAHRNHAAGQTVYTPGYRYASLGHDGEVRSDTLSLAASSFIDGIPPYYIAFSAISDTASIGDANTTPYLESITVIPKRVVDQFWADRSMNEERDVDRQCIHRITCINHVSYPKDFKLGCNYRRTAARQTRNSLLVWCVYTHCVVMSLLKRLGVSVPILQAPMAGVATPALAAAVSEAGGLGGLGIGTGSLDAARKMISETQRLTSRPFNVNLFVHCMPRRDGKVEEGWLDYLSPIYRQLELDTPSRFPMAEPAFAENTPLLDLLLELEPAVVSFHFGLPSDKTLERLRQAGAVLMATATNLDELRKVEQAGLDAVVAQGMEAGGHRGVFDTTARDELLPTLELVGLFRRHTALPIIAAGGLMDGRDINMVLRAGATAAQLGTAFISCPESAVDDAYRQALRATHPDDTTITTLVSGRPARGIKNKFTDLQWTLGDTIVPDFPLGYPLTKALSAAARRQGLEGYEVRWAGTQAGRARTLPAQELVRQLQHEMHEL